MCNFIKGNITYMYYIKAKLCVIIVMEFTSPLIKLFHIKSFHNCIIIFLFYIRLCCSCYNSDGYPDGRNKNGSLINGSHSTYLFNMAALIHNRMSHAMHTHKKPDFTEPLISKAYWGSGIGEDRAW